MEGGQDEAFASIYDKKNMPAILGDQDFKTSALLRAQLSLHSSHPAIHTRPSAELIVHQIGVLFDRTFDEITARSIGLRRLRGLRSNGVE